MTQDINFLEDLNKTKDSKKSFILYKASNCGDAKRIFKGLCNVVQDFTGNAHSCVSTLEETSVGFSSTPSNSVYNPSKGEFVTLPRKQPELEYFLEYSPFPIKVNDFNKKGTSHIKLKTSNSAARFFTDPKKEYTFVIVRGIDKEDVKSREEEFYRVFEGTYYDYRDSLESWGAPTIALKIKRDKTPENASRIEILLRGAQTECFRDFVGNPLAYYNAYVYSYCSIAREKNIVIHSKQFEKHDKLQSCPYYTREDIELPLSPDKKEKDHRSQKKKDRMFRATLKDCIVRQIVPGFREVATIAERAHISKSNWGSNKVYGRLDGHPNDRLWTQIAFYLREERK